MNNSERAQLAESALKAFCRFKSEVFVQDLPGEDAADLICNLLHLVKQAGENPMEIAALGVGMFTAEDRARNGEPEANDTATITVTPWGGEVPFTVFCQSAKGGGTIWISSLDVHDAQEASVNGRQMCARDWNVPVEEIHVLGVAKGDVEIIEWNDLD